MSKPWIRSVPQTSGLIRRALPFKAVKSIFHESLNADINFDKQIKKKKIIIMKNMNRKMAKRPLCLPSRNTLSNTHMRDS